MTQRSALKRRVIDLPTVIVLLILQFLSGSEPLSKAALAHRSFNEVIARYKDVLYTRLLRNEHGSQAFVHAVVSYLLARQAAESRLYPVLDSPNPGRSLE